ncbi:MAG: MnhB domain-containing protein [Chloroflexota bacterium]|jgi:multisubunit Na+/H+ antiporter MnhB subunit|nr:MnhB domain-containing protein [Chloroflexota bacterium]
MPELYLRLLDRVLTPILFVVAIFLFLRGHNAPGGGFIAGLVAAAAFELQILSEGDDVVRARIGRNLHPLAGIGLLCAASAALLGLLKGTFFQSVWYFGTLGALHIEQGTPVLFDLGVFLVVVSVMTTFLLGLSKRDEEPQR